MTFSGLIYGAIIGVATGWALMVSTPQNPWVGIAVGLSLTVALGLVFSVNKKGSR